MSRTIGDELRDNAVHLRNARNAIIGRGGTIASNAGWKDVPEAVLFIPNDASVAISATESNAYKVPVPTTSQGVARIDALGGNTRIVPGVNLINWADRFGYAVKPRVNDQEDYYSIDTIPSGRYRLYIDARPTIEDDCISLGYGFTTDMSVFYSSGDYIELNANSTIYAWCGASTWNSADPNISAMFNGTPIALDKTHTLTIGGASADGTPDFGYVTIATNTRVKVSLSHEFTNASEKGKTFIVGKGNYTFYWENAEVGTDLIATITLSHEIPYSVEARVYPMIYAVPDDSVEHILTEYIPYEEHLVPTAVTEIVSKGANEDVIDTITLPDAVKNDVSWGNGFSYTRDKVTSFVSNEYDFTEKKYTQYIPEKVILDGTTGHRFVGNSAVGMPRFYFPLQGKCKDFASVIATNFKTNYANAVGNVYLVANNAYFFLPSNITTLTQANEWLKENPIELVYALAEPTVTTIDDAPDKYINVEGGGEIVLKNNAEAAVPSTITFIRRI